MTIRPIAPTDSLAEITHLVHSAYKSLADMGFRFWGTWQCEEDTILRCSEGQCLVAECEGRLVGTVTVKRSGGSGDPDWYKREGVWVVTQFAVLPPLQGAGLGSALLTEAERFALGQGGTETAIDTAEGAKHLIEFYGKRGYRHVGRVDWSGTNYVSVLMSKCLTTTLTTERLVLRPLCQVDLEPIRSYWADDRFQAFYPPGRTTPESCAETLRNSIAEAEHNEGWHWAVSHEGAVVGRVRLSKRPSATGELGYELSPTLWGQGFASEAVRAVLRFGFELGGLHRVQAWVFANNAPSQRLLDRVGFLLEGRLREKVKWGDGRMDDLIYGMLAGEWKLP